MTDDAPIQIDIDSVLQNRLPKHYRYMPSFVIRWLERIICQRDMNELLRSCHGKRDAAFCKAALEYLDIDYTVNGIENLPSDRRVIIVSNHPLGGLDGMTLIDMLTQHYGPGLKVLVNDLLMAVEPLSGVFLPINKHGQQSRGASQCVEEALESDNPLVIFPAGLVSRKGAKGHISDLKWHKMFVNKAIKHHRDIIPLHFSGRNSSFFYNFAKLRTRLGLKFNIEMIRLPHEIFGCRGAHFNISIGKPVQWQSLKGGSQANDEAEAIRRIVYRLAH